MLFYSKTIPPSEPPIERPTSKTKDKEKIFVNDKIAAFVNRTGFKSLTGPQKYYRVLLLFYSKTIPPSEPLIESPTGKEKDKEKIFVNDKIAAFENRTGSSSDEGVTSPPVRKPNRKWQSKQEAPPDVIANGIKVSGLNYLQTAWK